MTLKELTKSIKDWEITHYTATYKPTGFQMWIEGYEIHQAILDEGTKPFYLRPDTLVSLWRWLRGLRECASTLVVGSKDLDYVLVDKFGNTYVNGERTIDNIKIVKTLQKIARQ